MGLHDPKPCNCGSGQIRTPIHDARGIFVAFVCDECEKDKLKGYRPEIFEDAHYEADEPIDEDY